MPFLILLLVEIISFANSYTEILPSFACPAIIPSMMPFLILLLVEIISFANSPNSCYFIPRTPIWINQSLNICVPRCLQKVMQPKRFRYLGSIPILILHFFKANRSLFSNAWTVLSNTKSVLFQESQKALVCEYWFNSGSNVGLSPLTMCIQTHTGGPNGKTSRQGGSLENS